jgi:hypothetical protein
MYTEEEVIEVDEVIIEEGKEVSDWIEKKIIEKTKIRKIDFFKLMYPFKKIEKANP